MKEILDKAFRLQAMILARKIRKAVVVVKWVIRSWGLT